MLAIGMITCRRTHVDVRDAIKELRWGGFDQAVHVFCEPDSPEIRPLENVVVHQNDTRLGVLGNWWHCLAWLLENTTSEYVMVCEDDVAFAKGAFQAWESAIHAFPCVGFWSLYTPRRDQHVVGHTQGWVASNRGRDTWGTQAMCFPRSSAGIVLKYPPLHNENQLNGATDAIVAQCFVEAGLPCYYHNPSLADHLGRVSSVGHNWYDEHVGLNFDREFRRLVGEEAASAEFSADDCKSSASPLRQHAVVTVYQNDVPQEVVEWHSSVVSECLPDNCDFVSRKAGDYATGLDNFFHELRYDAYLVLSVDCIPLTKWAISWLLENARAGIVIGAAQRAKHLSNGDHVFAGAGAVAFSRTTFERVGCPSFRGTSRGDVAEELTYQCEEAGVPVSLLWPTDVTTPKWTLRPGFQYGLGTTYGGVVYHAFEISGGQTVGMFIDKCQEVLSQERSAKCHLPE